MKVYGDAVSAVPSCDKLGIYDVYVARATAMFGVAKAREIYHRAICGGGLPDEDTRAICIRFADLEMGLGEVQHARTLYVYALGFTDPNAHPEFWKRWNEFEVLHGDESTFREMLRLNELAISTELVRDGRRRSCRREGCFATGELQAKIIGLDYS